MPKKPYYTKKELDKLDVLLKVTNLDLKNPTDSNGNRVLSHEIIKAEGKDLQLLHKIFTSDKSIIGENNEFGQGTRAATPNVAPGSPTDIDMKRDIVVILKAREAAGKPPFTMQTAFLIKGNIEEKQEQRVEQLAKLAESLHVAPGEKPKAQPTPSGSPKSVAKGSQLG